MSIYKILFSIRNSKHEFKGVLSFEFLNAVFQKTIILRIKFFYYELDYVSELLSFVGALGVIVLRFRAISCC